MLDLTPYIARGFPCRWDEIIATVGVAGIDLVQVQSEVRLCSETENVLYGPTFSPRRVSYRTASRPVLEQVVAGFDGSAAQRAEQAMQWVNKHVLHPHFAGPIAPDRGMSEEQLIESGIGYCNEQARVFVALCEVMQIPARMCFLWHENGRTAHTATEVLLADKWAFCDVTYRVRVQLPNGTFAEARELSRRFRELAHRAYRDPLERWIAKPPSGKPDAMANSIDVENGGDLLESVGICNYLIDGVQEVR